MNRLEIFLSLSSLSFQIALCGFVVARRVHAILPLFASFVYVVLASSICLFFLYLYVGFESSTLVYYSFWTSVFLFVATRSLAIGELCRYVLRNHQGIWALVWRVLAALSVFLIAHAAINAWEQPNGIAIYWTSFARDFALASLIIFAVLFLLLNYYGLVLDRLPRSIAIGICFTCAVDSIGNTILLNSFKGYLLPWFLESQKALWPSMESLVRHVYDIWSTVHLTSFMISMGIWCYALRKPLSQPVESPALLPANIYGEMSPAINTHLATFNERLAELLTP
jgi:hypothetical protein